MAKLRFNITMSLDGYVAGPGQSLENPLGEGGLALHDWAFATESFRAAHGMDGGETGIDDDHAASWNANIGATIMGRNMFGPVRGPWGDDAWTGWWGDDPPFHTPVFVLTRHPREPLEMTGGTTFYFVTDGIESALGRAVEAAGGRDVSLGGGADAAQQYLRAGLIDEMEIHVVPLFLGGGSRLFENLDGGPAGTNASAWTARPRRLTTPTSGRTEGRASGRHRPPATYRGWRQQLGGAVVATTRTAGDRIPLMLIHGAWLSSNSWENFTGYFEKRGFAVSAPEWPRKQGDVEELRQDADELKGLGITEIVDHYEQQIRALDEPPVLIGHSFGGLIVELLLDRGLGRAGVAMSPAPPKGILVLPFSSLKAAAPALAHPSKRHGVVTLTLEEFTYGFVNTFSPEEAAAAYERYAVPETGQIFYEAGFANFHLNPPTEVHFKSDERAPLLIVGAEKDHTVPASLARKQYEKYERSPAETEYVEFEGRPHLLMAAEGWEEVAASVNSWLDGVLDVTAVPAQDASA